MMADILHHRADGPLFIQTRNHRRADARPGTQEWRTSAAVAWLTDAGAERLTSEALIDLGSAAVRFGANQVRHPSVSSSQAHDAIDLTSGAALPGAKVKPPNMNRWPAFILPPIPRARRWRA